MHAVLDAKGNVKKTRLVRGYMKSAAKLTYGGVARALGFTEIPPRDPKAEAMVEGLKVAAECSRILRAKRMKRGALDFDLPEAVVKLDDEGKPISVSKRSRRPGHEEGLPAHRGADDLRQRDRRALAPRARAARRLPRAPPARPEEAR